MPLVMPHDENRARLIKKEMQLQQNDPTPLPTAKLIIKGKTNVSPIYRFRLDDLYYNKANGRIKAEVSELEAQLGINLDMSDEKDRLRVKDLLLNIRKEENDKIRDDLIKNGQLLPGIITCDGIIINGNRRRAILEELYAEYHAEKYNYLDVHVLPSDITKSEIWLIEAGIQLSAQQQLDYSPINYLLKLREGVDAGLDIGDMAARIYGVDEETLQKNLDRLKLIDQYLEDFLGKPGRYHLVSGLSEHFIDLQNILSWLQNPRGNVYRDWKPDDSDINELKTVAFYFIRARYSHWRIRELRDLFCRKNSWNILKQTLKVSVKAAVGESELDEGYESADEEPELAAEGDTVSIGGTQAEADRRYEKAWHNEVQEGLKTNFEDAKEQEYIEKDKEKPLALARRALRNIEGIPDDCPELKDSELDGVLSDIIAKINQLRKHTKKIRKHLVESRKSRKTTG